jgi:hypothetical protein
MTGNETDRFEVGDRVRFGEWPRELAGKAATVIEKNPLGTPAVVVQLDDGSKKYVAGKGLFFAGEQENQDSA